MSVFYLGVCVCGVCPREKVRLRGKKRELQGAAPTAARRRGHDDAVESGHVARKNAAAATAIATMKNAAARRRRLCDQVYVPERRALDTM
jgi:hypothetical protein